MAKIAIVTGAAGFIGAAMSKKLLENGWIVYGCDNLNDYYDVALKHARLKNLTHPNFHFEAFDLAQEDAFLKFQQKAKPLMVFHFAAQAGVRYSLENPMAYAQSNLVGSLQVLEAIRSEGIEHLLFASSSSVYGANQKIPFSENDSTDHPSSLYAASKKSCEMMAHSYAHLFGIRVTMLRFFTVYGPWGRPDMAVYKFTKAIAEGTPLQLFGDGKLQRDYTFIDDVVEAIFKLKDSPPIASPLTSGGNLSPCEGDGPYCVYNIGNRNPVSNLALVQILEKLLHKKAQIELIDKPSGDVESTCADTAKLHALVGFEPQTSLEHGLKAFIKWYEAYTCGADHE